MNIIGLGDYKGYLSYYTYGIMEGSFDLGHMFRPVNIFDNIDSIKKQIDEFYPDIIFTHCLYSDKVDRNNLWQYLSELKKKGVKIINQLGDARDEPRYPHDISHMVTLSLLNHKLIDKFSKIWNTPTIYWPYGTLNNKHAKVVPAFQKDIVFTGNLSDNKHHAFRKEFVMRLQGSELTVLTLPNSEFPLNTRFITNDIAISAKSVLGVQMGLEIPGYLDVRPFQYIGAGALYFHDKCDAIRSHFTPDMHYVEYERGNVEDLVRKWKKYVVDYPSEGKRIRETGKQLCSEWHSMKVRVDRVIRELDKL